jgi:predicted TIM-barrel fold metal-dependent hydrolase
MEDIGSAFEILKDTKNLKFDIAGHTNEDVFYEALDTFGPERILFGMDMPVGYMRLRREHINGLYINNVPEGVYANVSGETHMKEISGREAEEITFFAYESAASLIRAVKRAGLPQSVLEDVFYRNASDWLGQ